MTININKITRYPCQQHYYLQRGPNFRSDTFQLLPTLKQALIVIPVPAALLFTAKSRHRPNIKSGIYRLLPTLEQALIVIPVPAALLFKAKSRHRPNIKSGICRLLLTLGHRD